MLLYNFSDGGVIRKIHCVVSHFHTEVNREEEPTIFLFIRDTANVVCKINTSVLPPSAEGSNVLRGWVLYFVNVLFVFATLKITCCSQCSPCTCTRETSQHKQRASVRFSFACESLDAIDAYSQWINLKWNSNILLSIFSIKWQW